MSRRVKRNIISPESMRYGWWQIPGTSYSLPGWSEATSAGTALSTGAGYLADAGRGAYNAVAKSWRTQQAANEAIEAQVQNVRTKGQALKNAIHDLNAKKRQIRQKQDEEEPEVDMNGMLDEQMQSEAVRASRINKESKQHKLKKLLMPRRNLDIPPPARRSRGPAPRGRGPKARSSYY